MLKYLPDHYSTSVTDDMNHMVGFQGPIGSWLSHNLCSTINIVPILSMKAAIESSHHELHGDFQIEFPLMVKQFVISRGIMLIFWKGFWRNE